MVTALFFFVAVLIVGILIRYFKREMDRRTPLMRIESEPEDFEPNRPKTVRLSFPIVDDASNVEPGCEFRFKDDSANVIRIRWEKPSGGTMPHTTITDVLVAGASQPSAQRNIIAFIAGKDRLLHLVRDPHNKFDKNAIKAIGNW